MAETEGWGYPSNAKAVRSRKAHYFIGTRSLCGRWAFYGPLDNDSGGLKRTGDCAECWRRSRKRLEAKGDG